MSVCQEAAKTSPGRSTVDILDWERSPNLSRFEVAAAFGLTRVGWIFIYPSKIYLLDQMRNGTLALNVPTWMG